LWGLVRVEPEASALPIAEAPDVALMRRRAQYTAGIERIAEAFGAEQPVQWAGDTATLLFGQTEAEGLAGRTFRAAEEVWERLCVDLGLEARITAHVDVSGINPRVDELHAMARPGGVTLSEDLALALPEGMQDSFEVTGTTLIDGTVVYSFPAGEHPRAQEDPWTVLRRYAHGSEVRLLRYVGFRLHKRQPPRLDVRDVFVPSKVEEVASRSEQGLPAAAVALTEAFRAHRSLVILGDPGAGKTTLLRWLAVEAAMGRFVLGANAGICERLLPVLVSIGRIAELRRGSGSESSAPALLSRYLEERGAGDAGALEETIVGALESGRCLLLLDGLDEVASGEREGIRRWLESFAAMYPSSRFVVTSRLVGYAGLTLPEGGEVTLRPFDKAQIEQYVRALARAWTRWETGEDSEAEAEAQKLLDAIRANARLGALATNPFMLSALALVQRAEGKLPRHRVQAYQIFARALCETWGEARRIVAGAGQDPTIPYEEEALPLLGELALAMHERYPSGVAPEDFVLETLTRALSEQRGVAGEEALGAARAFLRRAGEEVQILIERGAGQWGFLHLTFQEFFAAAGLLAAERFEEVALERLFDPRWEEVIRLGVGIMALIQQRPVAVRRFVERVFGWEEPEPRRWVTSVLQRQIPVAALCAAEAGDALPVALQEKVARRFAAWVVERIGLDEVEYLHALVHTDFAEKVAATLEIYLQDANLTRRIRAFMAFLMLCTENPQMRRARMDDWLYSPQREHLEAAVSATLAFPNAAKGIEQRLLEISHNDLDPNTRVMATCVLVVHFGHQLNADMLLDLLSREDVAYWQKGLLAGALTGSAGIDDIEPALLAASCAPDERRRAGAALALSALGSDAALDALLCAAMDSSPSVRCDALKGIGKIGLQKIPNGNAVVLNALHDSDRRVRVTALRFCQQRDVLLAALNDTDPDIRAAALRALQEQPLAEDEPLFLAALSDPSPSVRDAAAPALANLGSTAAIPHLVALASSSEAARAALWKLAKLAPSPTS
jgi:HEAT repeat protein